MKSICRFPKDFLFCFEPLSFSCLRRFVLMTVLAVLAWGGSPTPVGAATYVNRPGGSPTPQDVRLATTNWNASGSPYLVEAQVTVNGGATLTVEPGVEVKCSANTGLYIEGNLVANNARFTDNGTGTWRGIYLSPGSTDSQLNGCVIHGAGAKLGYIIYADRYTAIFLDRCSPIITGCIIEECAGHGIESYLGSAVIQNNTFQNLGPDRYAICLNSPETFPRMSGNTATGTGIAGVAVPGGNFGPTNTWNQPGPNLSYFLNGELTLLTGRELTIEPGNVIRSAGQRLLVYGALKVLGTAAAPVRFTSRNPNPNPGDWAGIYLGPEAGKSVFRYCTLEYGGSNLGYIHFADRFTSLFMDLCSPELDHFTIANSLNHGLALFSASPDLSSFTAQNCGGHALVGELSSRPIVTDSSFISNGHAGNGYATVWLDASSVPSPSNLTFAGNRQQAVLIAGGVLASNATWKPWAANAPYWVSKDITVEVNTTLNLESGTVVKLQNSALYINGVLVANGQDLPISFTSWQDDTLGGDSDGALSTAAPADWKGIYLSPWSGASVLRNCQFRYAGSKLGYFNHADRYTAIYVNGSSPSITACSISQCAGHGVETYISAAELRDIQFADLATNAYAVLLDNMIAFPQMSGNSGTGGGLHGVGVPGGFVGGTNQWTKPGTNFPYFLNGELNLVANAQLSLDPGVWVQSENQRIVVEGTLLALGTAADPIRFTSRKAAPAPADWKGIYFGPASGNSILRYCTIAHAGGYLIYANFADRYTALYFNLTSPQLDHVTVAQSGGHGMELYGASPVITHAAIENCLRHGLRAEVNSRPQLSDAQLTGNGSAGDGYFAVSTDATSFVVPNQVTFAGNRLQGIQITGERRQTANGTWKFWATNAPYFVIAGYSVDPGATLTIESGCIVKFKQCSLQVSGNLVANGGTPGIVLTSYRDDAAGGDTDAISDPAAAADWNGIYLSANSSESLLSNCSIKYTGGRMGNFNYWDRYSAVYVSSSSPILTNCTFANLASHGAELFSSTAIVRSNQFHNLGTNAYAIVLNTLDKIPQMRDNQASGTGYPGVYVPGGNLATTMTWPKPGINLNYYLLGELGVPENVVWRIDPGVTIKSAGQRVMVYGTLEALGTPDQPITFTSRNPTPAPGDWKGIFFGSNAGRSTLNHCILNYAGMNLGYLQYADRFTSVFVQYSNPKFNNVQVLNSAGFGLELYASSATIQSSLICSNGRSGLMIEAAATPRVINNTIAANTLSGVHSAQSSPAIYNNISAFNQRNGLQCEGGTPVVQFNCAFGNTQTNYVGIVPGTNNLSADPLFLNAAAGDFHLNSASPCVNRGDSAPILLDWTDLDGHARIAEGSVDLGAYETSLVPPNAGADLLIRNAGETAFSGDNIFTVAQQTKVQTNQAGPAAIFYFQAQQEGAANDSLVLNGTGGDNGWTVKYFDAVAGGSEITQAITSLNGWVLANLPPGSVREFRVEVVASPSVEGHQSREILVSIKSQSNPAKADTVKAVAVNQAVVQPDAMIRRGQETLYTGKGVYNQTGAGQSKSIDIENGQSAVYYLQVQNAGNVNDTFLLRAPSSGPGWTARYYETAAGGSEITGLITGTGWLTPLLAASNSVVLRLEVTGSTNLADGAVCESLLTAASSLDPNRKDAVKARTTFVKDSSIPQGGIYTLNADFEKGFLMDVEYQTVPDQLQLALEPAVTNRSGLWTVVHNSRFNNAAWDKVSWTARQSEGTNLRVKARSSSDQNTWSAWEDAGNGVALKNIPNGKYLQVEVTFQSLSGTNSPVLYDLTIMPVGGQLPSTGPILSIRKLTAGGVELSWPDSSADYQLESCSSLSSPASWTPEPDTPTHEGDRFVYITLGLDKARFYRLKKP
jgi:hypothetical protein